MIQREPYRLFFPLGALFGIAGAGHWFLYGAGIIPAYSGFYHACVQTWLFMTCFVVGFLGTAVPRFTASPHASRAQIGVWIVLFLAVFTSLTASRWLWAELGYAALLASLGVFLVRCFHGAAQASPPPGFVWMPMAVLMGIAGTLAMAVGHAGITPNWLEVCGRAMEEQGFLMSLVIGIGSFLGPRLMGEGARIPEDKLARCHVASMITFFTSFLFEGSRYQAGAYAVRGAATFLIFWASGAIRFKAPRAGTAFSRYLAVIFWFFPISFFLIASHPQSKTLYFHILFIGGFSLLTLFISTMVTLSHAGEPERLRGSAKSFYAWVSILTTAALGIRLSAGYFGSHYFVALAVASSFWVASVIVWLAYLFKYFFKMPGYDAIEKIHQDIRSKKEEPHAC